MPAVGTKRLRASGSYRNTHWLLWAKFLAAWAAASLSKPKTCSIHRSSVWSHAPGPKWFRIALRSERFSSLVCIPEYGIAPDWMLPRETHYPERCRLRSAPLLLYHAIVALSAMAVAMTATYI